MHRRDFIRVLGGGAILASTAGCAPGGVDPRAPWSHPGAGETEPRRKALAWAMQAAEKVFTKAGRDCGPQAHWRAQVTRQMSGFPEVHWGSAAWPTASA